MSYLQEQSLEGFEWDEGNTHKSWLKHGISNAEAEQVFSNNPYYIYPDQIHSAGEERSIIIGKTDAGRMVFISFTVRTSKVRIISSRWMGTEEMEKFNEAIQANTKI